MREWTLKSIASICVLGVVGTLQASEPYTGLEIDETGARRQARLEQRQIESGCQYPQPQCQPQCNNYSYAQGNCCENPWRVFGQIDALFWNRHAGLNSPNVLNGADPLNFSGVGLDQNIGTRYKLSAGYKDFDLQFVYTNLGSYDGTAGGSLSNGVSFDDGILGLWVGGSTIDATTYFSPINSAAIFNNGVLDENDETDGFGPTATFLSLPPTYRMTYRSELDDFEFNVRHAPIDYWFKVGMGYRKINLDEFASVSLRGELRDHTDGGGVNEGLSHVALTDPNGGNLTHISGAADGFDDTVSLNGPDTLLFVHQAIARNNLEGGQVLIEPTIYEGDYFIFDTSFKAGVYSNQVQGRIVETYSGIINDNSVYGRVFTDTRNVTSFVGNAALNLGFKLTDHIVLRYGYEWMMMTDVALSPNQIRGVRGNTYEVQTDGKVYYQGSKLGLEARW